jgi:hypothetical protein
LLPSSVGAASYTASPKFDVMLDAVAAGVNYFWSRRAGEPLVIVAPLHASYGLCTISR